MEDDPLELEEALKADNPKGRLWEACAAQRISPPTIRHATVGTRHRVEMELAAGEWELSSGVQWGWSRKVAEQLASRALLDELDAMADDEPPASPTEQAAGDDDIFEVEEADVALWRQSNPKGQVYEWCQRQKPPVRRPRFEARPVRGATLVRGRLERLGLQSPWFRAPRRKEAEQAAAEALLRLLPSEADAAGVDLDAGQTANPRTLLNEMVQHGQLDACSVDVSGKTGPSHAPCFTAEGRARLPGGREIATADHEGYSKRTALHAAASALLALVEAG